MILKQIIVNILIGVFLFKIVEVLGLVIFYLAGYLFPIVLVFIGFKAYKDSNKLGFRHSNFLTFLIIGGTITGVIVANLLLNGLLSLLKVNPFIY